MQWIFMLIGLVLGASIGESFSAGLFGILFGLGLAQALQQRQLQAANSALHKELQQLGQRLKRLEQDAAAPAEPLAQAARPAQPASQVAEPPMPAASAPETAAVPADEALQFSLDEISLAAEPVSPANSQPLPERIWRAAPAAPEPAAPRAPAPVAAPREPGFLVQAWGWARDWLLGGNTVLRVGLLLLFLGLAFLLRYATEGMVVPVALRYSAVAASALALLGLGWWLRLRRPGYALLLQGTGVAVLYLTIFAALRLHPLLDSQPAFALLVLVTAAACVLAVAQNAQGLAVAAALGGFAAPILTSSGSGNHVALFSYFLLLNAGILSVAWFKAWRPLNLVGFVGTFGIGLAWGWRSYQPELLWSSEPFLVAFFLIYVLIGLLFTRRSLRQAGEAPQEREALLRWSLGRTDYVDATAMFGPPLVGFALQVGLVRHIEFAVAFSALALGGFYLLLALWLRQRAGARALLLTETCLALGVIFASLAIPLGLDAQWTSAAWAVEGAGIYWLGLRQQRRLARLFALLLQLAASLAYLSTLGLASQTVLAGSALGAAMLAGAWLCSYGLLRRHQAALPLWPWEARLQPWLALAGLLCAYLIAPLLLSADFTAMAWALGGLLTLLLGLRLRARVFLCAAFAVQLLGGVLFVGQLDGASSGQGMLASGWSGLLLSLLIGLALIGSMLLASRDALVREDRRLLRGLALVLLAGLLLINLAVLFVLPWRTACAVWAGNGLVILWLALRLQQRAAFVFALLLQGVAGCSFFLAAPLWQVAGQAEAAALAHAGFWTPALLGLAALLGAWRLWRENQHGQAAEWRVSLLQLSWLLLAWGLAWWVFAWVSEIDRLFSGAAQSSALLALAAACAALAGWLAGRLRWAELGLASLLLVPAAWAILAGAAHALYQPAAAWGWLGWLAVGVVHMRNLRQLATQLPGGACSAAHVLGLWLLLLVPSLQLRYLLMQLAEQYNAWRWLGWALLPSLYLLWVARASRLPWPLASYPREYRLWAAAPLAGLLLVWFWLANAFSAGNADPLPYLPLLNPLELGLLLALSGAALWAWQAGQAWNWPAALYRQGVQGVLGLSLFALATAMVFRSAHHWGDVPYAQPELLRSMLVQAGLSLVWTSIALGLMIAGHLRVRREWWLLGGLLIGVVVAKLFFVELGNRGGLERIVSFIGVGVLLLVVGYFAPLPPRQDAAPAQGVQG